MAVGSRLSETSAAWARRWIVWPTWARILLVYAAARVVTTGLVLLAWALAPSPSQLGSAHPLADLTLGWDAQWYWLVAVDGYPSDLPHDPAGYVSQNPWAFLPVYAYVARAVGFVFGDQWGIGAFVVSIVSGYLACLALHALIRIRQGRREAMWATVLFASGPLAALFHVGYAESLFLALLLAALLCVARRRWGWLYVLVPVTAFTRPGILPFALMLAMYGIWRWIRRRSDPLTVREGAHIVALGLIAAVAGFAWQAIAAAVTGEPGAYLDTELAWRRAWVGTERFLPLQGWFEAADVWFGVWGLPAGAAALAVVVVIVGATALVLLPRAVKRIGPELRMWSASYLVYLFLVFFPQSSVFRLLVPLAPMSGAVAALRLPGVRTRTVRLTALGLCLVGQWLWIWFMYGHGTTYWQVP